MTNLRAAVKEADLAPELVIRVWAFFRFRWLYGWWPSWRSTRLERFLRIERRRQKTCRHEGYSFARHGRCCFDCGMFLVDFGD